MTHETLDALGVLVVAPDLQAANLNDSVKHLVSEVRLTCPKVTVLVSDTAASILSAVESLNVLGANRVIVVPLLAEPGSLPAQATETVTVTPGFGPHILLDEILAEQNGAAVESLTLEALLPHPKLARYIEWRIAAALHPALTYWKDDTTRTLGFDEAQALAVAAGASYPCSTLATRITHLAFRLLWDDMPEPAGMEVVSQLPPEVGSRPVLEALAGAEHVTYTGDWYNVTPDSPAFTITNPANGRQLRVAAQTSTYGGEAFFALRHRNVNGQGDPEDAARVKEYFQVILSNLLLKPDAELFEWEVTGA
jgi:hypothetical protein